MSFNAGDIVICVDSLTSYPSDDLVLGKEYIVRGRQEGFPDIFLEGCVYSWRVDRFRLVVPPAIAPKDLTIQFAQKNQPWTVPYATGVKKAKDGGHVPHILATHCALHAAKSVGKLAAVFEELDHPVNHFGWVAREPSTEQLQTVKDMSADLITAALRFANLYEFDLATELMRRVKEKNGVGYGE